MDTNVVVSGLLTSRSDAPTARILDGMLQGRFPFLLSMELLAEYRAVILRPRIRQRHGLTEREIDLLLTELAANARFREPPTAGGRGDDHLWALLAEVRGSVLVTGDRPLAADSRGRGKVVSPREFVTLMEG